MASAKPAPTHKKYFTLEEANRALPLVNQIAGDIVKQWEIVNDLEQRLSAVARGASKSRMGDIYDEEVVQSEAALDAERETLQGFITELKELGVELKGFDGLCDFPSLKDGREIYLCWRLGEPEIHYWHELHTGFAGRQPLPRERRALESASH
jgi:hypothetical protein